MDCVTFVTFSQSVKEPCRNAECLGWNVPS